MSYRLAKILLKKYINISFLCKTIELVTILTLQLYKNKILSSQKIIKLFFCFLKENYKNNFLSLNHLVVPIFTDKSCSGIINNLGNTINKNIKLPIHPNIFLKSNPNLFVLSLYQNVMISFLGTSLKFKKNVVLTSYSKSIVSNFYNLSDETVNSYVSFMLLKEITFLEYDYFYFNEFVNINTIIKKKISKNINVFSNQKRFYFYNLNKNNIKFYNLNINNKSSTLSFSSILIKFKHLLYKFKYFLGYTKKINIILTYVEESIYINKDLLLCEQISKEYLSSTIIKEIIDEVCLDFDYDYVNHEKDKNMYFFYDLCDLDLIMYIISTHFYKVIKPDGTFIYMHCIFYFDDEYNIDNYNASNLNKKDIIMLKAYVTFSEKLSIEDKTYNIFKDRMNLFIPLFLHFEVLNALENFNKIDIEPFLKLDLDLKKKN